MDIGMFFFFFFILISLFCKKHHIKLHSLSLGFVLSLVQMKQPKPQALTVLNIVVRPSSYQKKTLEEHRPVDGKSEVIM